VVYRAETGADQLGLARDYFEGLEAAAPTLPPAPALSAAA
jgi:hypothetical protein